MGTHQTNNQVVLRCSFFVGASHHGALLVATLLLVEVEQLVPVFLHVCVGFRALVVVANMVPVEYLRAVTCVGTGNKIQESALSFSTIAAVR